MSLECETTQGESSAREEQRVLGEFWEFSYLQVREGKALEKETPKIECFF